MTSREDALFDENKYYFPEGAAAILKERTEQPWLEVTAERDEQGTPGLQPVPDEQKYVQQLNVSGIKGLYEDTEYLPAHVVANGPSAATAGPSTLATGHAAGRAFIPLPTPTTSYSNISASEEQQSHDGMTESSLTEPWSQPETTNSYGQEQQQQVSQAPSTRPEIQYHHSWTSSIGSDHNNQSIQPQVEQAQQQWSLAVPYQAYGCQPPVTSQATSGIIGGVVGSRHSGNDSRASSNSSSAATYQMTSIRRNSRLAVTGYRGTSGNYTLRLFFQDQDHNVLFMDKSSTGGIWTEPVTLDTLAYKPKPYGSIAAGSYIYNDPNLIEFFYMDTTSKVRGQKMSLWTNTGLPRKGQPSSINPYQIPAAVNSSLSCYFPYLVSQDSDNAAQTRWTRLLTDSSSDQSWETETVANATDAAPGAEYVLLPVAQEVQENAGFVYRTTGGALGLAMKDYAGGDTLADVSWTRGALSARGAAPGSAVGAFVVGRPYTANDINTYVLYQSDETSGDIQVVWQDGDGWRGPESHDVLRGAEPGSDIECLTQGAWAGVGMPVSRAQDMNRCFFQEKGTGKLREVWFNGTDWRNEGYVPLE
ncbi:hypothetical protein LQW54_011232 [Pestalotiopsis sp. IQ-011]